MVPSKRKCSCTSICYRFLELQKILPFSKNPLSISIEYQLLLRLPDKTEF